jgi:hypothetical protein
MTNQPTPITGFKDDNSQTDAALNDSDESLTELEELRRKLCAPPPMPQKSKWRFW